MSEVSSRISGATKSDFTGVNSGESTTVDDRASTPKSDNRILDDPIPTPPKSSAVDFTAMRQIGTSKPPQYRRMKRGKTINDRVGRVRRMFKFAASAEIDRGMASARMAIT